MKLPMKFWATLLAVPLILTAGFAASELVMRFVWPVLHAVSAGESNALRHR